jgi:hydroxyethylthiazole kinase-like uncharacterized protein yjeF
VKLVDSKLMSSIDRRSQAEYGYPSILLMENAGIKAVAALRKHVWKGAAPRGSLVFVAGKGNNGGDAMVIARQCLLDGVGSPQLILAGEPDKGTDPGINLEMCKALGIRAIRYPENEKESLELVAAAGYIFDGIAGTGLRGPLGSPLDALVAAMNASPGIRVAIDTPSGVGDGYLEGNPAVRAEITLAMGLPKICLYLPKARAFCGKIIVVPLGFPPALVEDPSIPGELLEGKAFRRYMPRIPADVHKGRRGHLAVFAGAPGTTGAAWLCATAAARARLGLVTAFLGRDVYPIIAPKFTSVMARPLDDADQVDLDLSRFDALLVGPGWGVSAEKAGLLEKLLSSGLPGVMDADCLTLLANRMKKGPVDLLNRWVLTPHPGEFARLSGTGIEEVLRDPITLSLKLSSRLKAVIVLKGACTHIASVDGRYWIYDGVNPTLATGGSGDVLAGIVAAGIAGGMEPREAALFGVSLHGRVGKAARARLGWYLAEDMLPLIGAILGMES